MNPWFVAKEACEVLEMTDHRQATRYLDDDEKGVFTKHTPGGPQVSLNPNLDPVFGISRIERQGAINAPKLGVVITNPWGGLSKVGRSYCHIGWPCDWKSVKTIFIGCPRA